MLVDWKQFVQQAGKAIGNLAKGNPKLMAGVRTLEESGTFHGALDTKTRELIALAVAATTRCDTCIGIHAKAARDAGATREELLDALGVAVGMNAGAALVYSSHILEAFDALEK